MALEYSKEFIEKVKSGISDDTDNPGIIAAMESGDPDVGDLIYKKQRKLDALHTKWTEEMTAHFAKNR